MYAAITTYRVIPEKTGKLSAIWKRVLKPAAKKMEGFKGGFLMVDNKASKAIGIGFWDSRENALAFGTCEGLKKFRDQVADILAVAPSRQLLEVEDMMVDLF